MIGYFDPKDGMPKITIKIRGTKNEKEVKAGLIPNPNEREAIVGVELFAPYTAIIDFKNKELRLEKR